MIGDREGESRVTVEVELERVEGGLGKKPGVMAVAVGCFVGEPRSVVCKIGKIPT